MTPGTSESQVDYEDYLRDILDNIEKVERFTAGVDFDAFFGDDKTAYAVIRALEIIGEASSSCQRISIRNTPKYLGAISHACVSSSSTSTSG